MKNCINCSNQKLNVDVSDKGIELDVCPKCNGVWFDKGEILFFTKSKSDFKNKLKQAFLNRSISNKKSPINNQTMDQIRYENTIPMYFCNESQGIWIDKQAYEDLQKIEPDFELNIIDSRNTPDPGLASNLLPLPNLFFHGTCTLVGLFLPVIILSLALMSAQNDNFYIYGLIGIGISIILAFFSPKFMDWQLNNLFKMEWKQAEELPEHLRLIIDNFCAMKNMKFPKFGLIDDNAPQAFTYGYTRNTARVVISKGLLNICNKEEAEAVIAHELGHIRNRDVLIMTVAQFAPLILYAIYQVARRQITKSKNSSSKDDLKSNASSLIIAIIALSLYKVARYILLWFSRVREYHADRFSGEFTKNPNALATALVKIGYGLAATSHEKDENENNEEKDLSKFQRLSAMGIFSLNASKSLALASNQNSGLELKAVKESMNWEIYSPWAKFYELFSTHPLIVNRIKMLSNQAIVMGQKPVVDLTSKPNIKMNTWTKFWIELIMLIIFKASFALFFLIAGITTLGIFGVKLSLQITVVMALACFLLGLFVLFYSSQRYKSTDDFNECSIASLLKVINLSPLKPVPCTIKGKVLGKGNPGYKWSEDYFIKDETGIIYADYSQPLAVMEFFSAAKHGSKFIDKEVVIKGWYFREPVPYLHIKEFSCDGKILKSHTHSIDFGLGYIMLVTAAYLLFTVFFI